MNIFNLPNTEEDAAAFLQEKGILPSSRICKKKHEMTLSFGAQSRWRCNKCRTEVGLRVGNWLEGCRLPLVTIVRFIYGWSFEYTSGRWCKRELNINEDATVDWNNYLRKICANSLLQRPRTKIGGKSC